MLETYTCSSDYFLENSRIPTRVMPSEAAMYEEMAQIMVDTIREHRGEKTVIICPVGPIGQYVPFVRKVNELNLSLKKTYMINMDEYLDNEDQPIDPKNMLSFRGIMEREVYSQIKPELLMPEEQRLFPLPGKEEELDQLIEKIGPPDCCLTGVGINGHIAFNEPPEDDQSHTVESFSQLGTRCLDLSMETIVNNGANKVYGALDIMPRRCITLGMKQLLSCKMIKIYLYCPWQWGIMRKIGLEPASVTAPASFLQNHPNSEMVITQELLEKTL